MSAAMRNPPIRRRWIAENRAQTSSSSGRSTWQETTAYRSLLKVPRLYRHAYLVLVLAASVPRLAALLYERDDILAAYTDKSDDFALTFLDSGTYGFIPGVPSAYTQPLYGFFLIPIYWVDRSWVTVGIAHIAVAVLCALLVFEIGRRIMSERLALLGALLATLHPYLVWHDVHLNREILDQALAALVVLLALVAAERGRRTLWWAAFLGGAIGLAILGNARLALLPLVVGLWLVVRLGRGRQALLSLVVVCAATAVVLAPWVARNKASVGCFAITTDSRALWKANNLNTYDVLDRGGWIDDVPPLPGSPPSPQDAGAIYQRTGRIVRVDECAQMRIYRDEVVDFWREHPGEKLRLAGQSARLLWQPNVLETEGRPGAGTWRDTARSVVEPAFMITLYVLALVGVFILPRSFVVLALALLGYQTFVAMLFAGATRYRVPWDFLLALMAAAGIGAIAARVRARRREGYTEPGSSAAR
jgi:4-amino-4-deoxy-L-arabinose transferase-like glycosyltransferase